MTANQDRLLAAACRYLAAERGGLDGGDPAAELANAQAVLDESAVAFVADMLPDPPPEDPPPDPPDDPPPDPSPAHVVGYLGNAVMAHQVAEGAQLVGGSPMWPSYGVPYHGGSPEFYASFRTSNASLGALSQPSAPHWAKLDEQLALYPGTTDLWLLACYIDDEWHQSQDPAPKLAAVIARVREHWTGRLHVSALPYMEQAGPPCKSSKDAYVDAVWAAIDARVATIGDILRGPELPPPTSAEKQQPSGAAQPGRCFVNERGMAAWGAFVVAVDWSAT